MRFRSAIAAILPCAFLVAPFAAAADPPFQLSQWARPGHRHMFDFGRSSALAGAGAQTVVVTVEFTATEAAMPVTAVQQGPSVGGLQLAAFAVHDVTPPANGSLTYR